jgi:hypothetical protein
VDFDIRQALENTRHLGFIFALYIPLTVSVSVEGNFDDFRELHEVYGVIFFHSYFMFFEGLLFGKSWDDVHPFSEEEIP